MGYGARARVHVGIRTEVEPIWSHPPSLAPVSLPSAALEPLPCAHLAQNPPSLWMPNGVFYPVLRHREHALSSSGAATSKVLNIVRIADYTRTKVKPCVG